MDDQPQGVEDAHEKMMSVLEAEETLGDEPEEIESQGEEAESEEESTEDAEIVEEATEEITYNGETKVVTKSQLKELAQKGFDYTQKTQAVAEERRSLQAQASMLQAQTAIHSQLADVAAEVKSIDNQLAQYKQIDWTSLAEQDPVQYLKLNQTYRDLKDAREEKAQEYNVKAHQIGQWQEQNRAQALQAEAALLAQKIPEFSGPKAAQAKESLANFLQAEGFTQSEVMSIMDHRMVSVAWKAAQYDKLKAAKPEINKRVAEAPKVVKGKQPTNQNTTARNDLKQKLRQTGRDEYAAKLIESLI
jgi:SOS response regulatory protein OraA/RecX